jgi:hypothetical protein
MYTVRDFTKTAQDLSESLRKIRDIGYPAVQLSAVGAMNGDSPEVSPLMPKKMWTTTVCSALHTSQLGTT